MAPLVIQELSLGFVIMFYSYDYFSFSVSFFKIPESFGDLT